MERAKSALQCVECRKEAGEAAPGWQAYLVSDLTPKTTKKSWSIVPTARGESLARST